METATQVLLTVGVPTGAVLIGILVNHRQNDSTNKRIEDLDRHVDARLVSLRNELAAYIQRVEGVLDARLRHVEEILRVR